MAEIRTFQSTSGSSRPSRREMWRLFCEDKSLREDHQITDHETALLERTALLGEFHSVQDLLFVLNAIRGEASSDTPAPRSASRRDNRI